MDKPVENVDNSALHNLDFCHNFWLMLTDVPSNGMEHLKLLLESKKESGLPRAVNRPRNGWYRGGEWIIPLETEKIGKMREKTEKTSRLSVSYMLRCMRWKLDFIKNSTQIY